MKSLMTFLSLFTSLSTLICCALPALFVVLGLGASFAGLVANIPGLIWISEHKLWVFTFGGLMLLAGGLLQYKNRLNVCPINEMGQACRQTRDWSRPIYFVSLTLYLVGFSFSYLL